MPENEIPRIELPKVEQPERPKPSGPIPPPPPIVKQPPPIMCPILTHACVLRNDPREILCSREHCGFFNRIAKECGRARYK